MLFDKEELLNIETISQIPLWKELYEKFTKNKKDLPTSDFWIELRQICHISPEEAQSKAEMVRKAYLDDIADIESPKEGNSNMDNKENQNQTPNTLPPQIIGLVRVGDFEFKLPKEGLKEAWEKAKKMVDIYIGMDS